jgi:hypothetical protein
MALTAVEQRDVVRWLLAQQPALGQTYTKPDLIAAVVSTDAWITSNKGATSTNTGFNTTLAAPFSAATAAQKTLLFCAVALKQAGVI